MEEIDKQFLTGEQVEDWSAYSVIPGPVHNNFDVCEPSCYVLTFEHLDRKNMKITPVDVYVINHDHNQTIYYRDNAEWEGSYGSMPTEVLFKCIQRSDLHMGIFHALYCKGMFLWLSKSEIRDAQERRGQ